MCQFTSKKKEQRKKNPKQGAKVRLRNGLDFFFFFAAAAAAWWKTLNGDITGLNNLGRVTSSHLIPCVCVEG